ncbi:hypothetical protein HZQ94_14740 [Elizabethkingia anophelis]|nr:hypothetical protein [Elizabethkingia anophelis]MCT3682077.1 hypothetical protein [Elizabethkingia anophelis]
MQNIIFYKLTNDSETFFTCLYETLKGISPELKEIILNIDDIQNVAIDFLEISGISTDGKNHFVSTLYLSYLIFSAIKKIDNKNKELEKEAYELLEVINSKIKPKFWNDIKDFPNFRNN